MFSNAFKNAKGKLVDEDVTFFVCCDGAKASRRWDGGDNDNDDDNGDGGMLAVCSGGNGALVDMHGLQRVAVEWAEGLRSHKEVGADEVGQSWDVSAGLRSAGEWRYWREKSSNACFACFSLQLPLLSVVLLMWARASQYASIKWTSGHLN